MMKGHGGEYSTNKISLELSLKLSKKFQHIVCGQLENAESGNNGNGNRTTPFFAYCFDDQVSNRRPPCGTPRLADKRQKNSDLYMLA